VCRTEASNLFVRSECEHEGSPKRTPIDPSSGVNAIGDETLHVSDSAPVEAVSVDHKSQRVPGPSGLIRIRYRIDVTRNQQAIRFRRSDARNDVRLCDAAKILVSVKDRDTAARFQLGGDPLRRRDVAIDAHTVECDQARREIEQ
jgi:hypothetical protein